jgi:hypothetical protein
VLSTRRDPRTTSHTEEEEIMAFVQIMEFGSSKYDEIREAAREWEKATEGRRTVKRSVICQDRDQSGRYVIVVFFDSYEEAMKNSELPETQALSERLQALADGPPSFRNVDVIEELV